MILKSSTRGSAGLGAHLQADENERARVTAGRGILSTDTENAVAELTARGTGSSTKKPLVHASLSPDQLMTKEQWKRAWKEWEQARGLEGQPYIEVEHKKKDRVHRHRVYSRVDVDRGAAIKQSHEKRINERVARSLEVEFGHELTAGRHNKAVMSWAQESGHTALAEQVAPLTEQPRPQARMTQKQWQQKERTGVDPREVAAAAASAWQQSDSPDAFRAALGERGLLLAQGRKNPQIVDQSGGTHDVRRTLNQADQQVRAADVRGMIPAELESVDEAREQQRERQTEPAPEQEGPTSDQPPELSLAERARELVQKHEAAAPEPTPEPDPAPEPEREREPVPPSLEPEPVASAQMKTSKLAERMRERQRQRQQEREQARQAQEKAPAPEPEPDLEQEPEQDREQARQALMIEHDEAIILDEVVKDDGRWQWQPIDAEQLTEQQQCALEEAKDELSEMKQNGPRPG